MKEKKQNLALLVMDMQMGNMAVFPEAHKIVHSVAEAIASARKKNIPVIFVVVGFRDGIPEVGSSSAKSFAGGKSYFLTRDMEEFMGVVPALSPREDEPIVVKRRVSAFTGSDLEVLLRAQDINHLVLSGIATGGVVLSTLREAADKDFKLTVLSDCCADRDDQVHHLLTSKVFTHQADVVSVSDWRNSLED